LARASSGAGSLWTVDAQGQLTKHVVKTGLTDGTRTQVEGTGIDAGTKVVIGSTQSGSTPATAATNPLQPSTARSGGRGGPSGGF
jgi:hypothetical protein